MDESSRLNSVAEALAHVEAPQDAVAWARELDHDFPEAWRTCPDASWLIHLAHTARMPFASILTAVTAASRYFLDIVPRAAYADMLEIDVPLAELAGNGVAGYVDSLRELVSTDAFTQEERSNLGYGDGFVEQAYSMAANICRQLEAALIAECDHSSTQARERVLATVREHTSIDVFLRAYIRCVEHGYAGLELAR